MSINCYVFLILIPECNQLLYVPVPLHSTLFHHLFHYTLTLYRLSVHTPSIQEKTREALKTLRSVHEKECEKYRSNPTIHPDVGTEYRLFCNKKIQSILALGGDPTQYNMANEWHWFWIKRMEEIFLDSWRIKKEQCLDMLEAHQKSPSLRVHRSHSFSSISSSSFSYSEKSKKKKKRRKKRLPQGSKSQRKKHKTKTSSTETYPKDRRAERRSSISDGSKERYSSDYSIPTLSENGDTEEELKDVPVTKMPNMSREAKIKEWFQKVEETQHPSPPHVAQPSEERQSQSAIMSHKKKRDNHTPSPSQISKVSQELDHRCLPSPSNQSVIASGSQQHTPKHGATENISMDDVFSNSTFRAEKVGLKQPEQDKVTSHSLKQNLWHQLSGKKCVTVSSGNPEAAVSEARGNPDTWNPSDSMMKEENQRNTFSGQPSWQKAHASVGKSQQGQAQQDILKLDTMQPATKVTTKPSSTQPRGLDTHYNQDTSQSISQIFKNFAQNTHTAHRDEKNTSEGISHIFKGFAGNTGDKPGTSGSTRHSPEDEVLSTKASSECTKIDVVNVLEVLTHLGDKLGALCDPLKLVLERTKELQTNGADPMAITNDQDSKLLLQMIQEKLQGILKDGNLNIIKKVIIQEAEQRLSVLLDLQEQRSLTGNLNLVQLARHCLNMDTTATVDFIRKILQCQGHTHLSERQLMKLYMAVKSEQLKVVGDHHDDRAATLTDNNCQSHNKPEAPLGLQVIRDSAGSLRGSSSALSLPHAKSHAPASHFDSLPWRGRQPCSDTAQRTQNTLDPDLQWETFNYPQEAVTGNIKPSKTSPSQSSTFQSWSPQCHTTVPHLKASTSTLHDSSQDAFRESRYHQKTPRFMYKKPICITLPKHEPQKSIVGSFNPLEDYETDNEEY